MLDDLSLNAYSYDLPEECIAQRPADKRDQSRLMVVNTVHNTLQHRNFDSLVDIIGPKDMLVVNDTKVFPARLFGKKQTGGNVEVFLLEFPTSKIPDSGYSLTTALIKASKRPRQNAPITISDNLSCSIVEELGDGKVKLQLQYNPKIGLIEALKQAGQIPLPPYISRKDGSTEEDVKRYQTVYAKEPGAVAAPTAGLHFTKKMINDLSQRGISMAQVTLHVGYGTFAPVRRSNITRHQIHREYINIPITTVEKINERRLRGGRIWAVGTTTVRALEFGAMATGKLEPIQGWCDLYIYPGFKFRVIDNLITNFHLPNSSLMFLVSALCSRKNLLDCYQTAIKEGYRFFSYGDAMAVITRT